MLSIFKNTYILSSASHSITLDKLGLLCIVNQSWHERYPHIMGWKALMAENDWMALIQEKAVIWGKMFLKHGLLFLNQSVLARSICQWRNRKTPERNCQFVSHKDNFLAAWCQESVFPIIVSHPSNTVTENVQGHYELCHRSENPGWRGMWGLVCGQRDHGPDWLVVPGGSVWCNQKKKQGCDQCNHLLHDSQADMEPEWSSLKPPLREDVDKKKFF